MSGNDVPPLLGRQFGVYRIESPLGAGGMGVVYRARDTRLGRDVALKVLPPAFARDADRLARFKREARVLASLKHANIVTIHGVEESDAITALVMELVDGETLEERLEKRKARGKGLDAHDALTIARQITDGLDAAHEKGIVHRDLKPANIKITPEGVVKLLDFGLAWTGGIHAVDGMNGDEARSHPAPIENEGTQAGMILGTAAYMSPEQARGLPVDRRTDIWAFGCVLFEMLAGRRPFDGATASDVIASVIGRAAAFEALPPDTPEPVRRLLRRCLEQDSRDRLRDIGDARADIGEALALPGDGPERVAPPNVSSGRWRRLWTSAGAAALAGVVVWFGTRPAPAAPAAVSRLTIAVPRSLAFMTTPFGDVAISADGARFAYRTAQGLVVRSRDGLHESLLRLDGAVAHPFFSPDGQWIGYSSGPRLRKVSVAGGVPVTVATTAPGLVGRWGPEGIVFADVSGLFRVAAGGGTPEKLRMADLDAGEQASFPEPLPGGTAVLITVLLTRTNAVTVGGTADSRIDAVDLRTGVRRTVVHGGGAARYIPSGHLVYAAGGRLHAVAFDAGRLEVRGNAVPLSTEAGASDFAVSSEGSLIYVADGWGRSDAELVWVDRDGRQESLGAPPRPYVYPKISPDGTRVALVMWGASRADRDVWIWDLQRKALEQLIVDPTDNPTVAWSLDGSRLAFGSARVGGVVNTFWQASNGGGAAERLLSSPRVQMPATFARDGRLLVNVDVPGESRNIVALSLDGTQRTEPIVAGPASDLSVDVSPDGRWMAYDSNESGQFEVYVRPYPNAAQGRWAISTGGGRQPVWSPDGRELFYRDFTGAMMAVTVTTTPSFVPGPPVELFDGTGFAGSGSAGSSQTFDISKDGRRFLMIKTARAEPSLVMVLNWDEEVKRLVPR
ncbi:MAG: protein kinase [Acidobacteriota bacterium]